jgi:hypothetical protein
MISVTFEREGKLAFPSAGRRRWGWVYNNQYQNEYIKMNTSK